MTSDALFNARFDDGIHHITALQPTSEAVAAILAHIESLFADAPMRERILILLDFHLIPTLEVTEWSTPTLAFFRSQGPETDNPSRAAYIYVPTARGSILNVFLRIQRSTPQGVNVWFFQKEEMEQAREWLQAA
jgi:hypothetical protein